MATAYRILYLELQVDSFEITGHSLVIGCRSPFGHPSVSDAGECWFLGCPCNVEISPCPCNIADGRQAGH